VLITHDIGIARRMPRRIEVLDGRIVADTTAVQPDTAVQPAERS
jgi:putative ABC transport system ATP-binding protein